VGLIRGNYIGLSQHAIDFINGELLGDGNLTKQKQSNISDKLMNIWLNRKTEECENQ